MKYFLTGLCLLVISLTAQAVDWNKTASDLMSSSNDSNSTTSSEAIDYAKGLIPALKDNANVTGEQAKSGSGVLFDLVKGNLGETDFASLKSMVPELNIDKLIAAAPAVADNSASLTSMLGSSGDSVAAVQKVYEQFKSLNLSSEQVAEYINVTQGYLQSDGGQAAVDLFKKGLGSLAGA